MVEEITQSQNVVPFEIGKKSSAKSQDSGFGNFLKETQSEFSAKEAQERETKGVKASKSGKKEEVNKDTLAKSSTDKETKKTKGSAQSEEVEEKEIKGNAPKVSTKEESDDKASEDSLGIYKLSNVKNAPQSPTTSVLSQVLSQQNALKEDVIQAKNEKAGGESKTTLPLKDSKDSSIAKGIENPQSPKTLQDVKNLAQLSGLNPTKVEALQDEKVGVQPKTKEEGQDGVPESAKYKIQYKVDDGERIAVIHRGTQKPQNITSKISSIYETIKVDSSSPTLSSLFGLKDLP